MDRVTGRMITGAARRRQQIQDAVTTPFASRCLARLYGCHLFYLVDAPSSPATTLKVVATVAYALANCVSGVRMVSASVTVTEDGRARINIQYEDLEAQTVDMVEVEV